MSAKQGPDILIQGAAQVLTCAANSPDGIGLRTGVDIAIQDGVILCVEPPEVIGARFDTNRARLIDAAGKTILPGFVDCHTHLAFGGDRVEEYAASLTGMSREEMAERGIPFGLSASMERTRGATGGQLVEQSLVRLGNMLRSGTTTAEIKSGYGLETETELRQLRAVQKLGELQPISLHATFLGAHAWPPGTDKADYIDLLVNEMIPRVAGEDLAEFCDIWCDDGYYTAAECRKVLRAALEAGMLPKIHTGAYSYIGGADLAAQLGAVSADHLNYTPEEALKKLVDADVVGVLLPGTDFCVNHPKPFDIGPMRACGLKMALATNLNPGCWIESMRTIMVLATRRHGMTPEEAIVAATLHGAMALALEESIGSLEPGKAADLQIWDTDDYRDGIYHIDRNPVEMVLKNGAVAVGG